MDNKPFEENSWYFRNALVRANYNDAPSGVHETTEFLERFFEMRCSEAATSSRTDTRMSTGSMGAKTLKAQMMTFQSAIIALWIALWRNSLYYVYL